MAKNKKAKHARLASRAATSNRGSFKNSSRAQAHAHGRTTSTTSSHRKPLTPQHERKPKKAHHQPSQSAAYIPFTQTGRNDILLVGEGDFSFAQSLAAKHHTRWRKLAATSYESREMCLDKYSRAASAVDAILAQGTEEDDKQKTEVLFGIDATKLASYKELRNGRAVEKTKRKSLDRTGIAAGQRGATGGNAAPLGTRQSRTDERLGGGWDWIVFNFPHVGGLSTDQRRQVRANQEMLVAFFESATEVLRRPGAARRSLQTVTRRPSDQDGREKTEADADRYNTDDEDGDDLDAEATPNTDDEADKMEELDNDDIKAGGRILLTLFDGLPYTLWNVRDLARHAGLIVERSFKFQASAYPGYEHARTLGDLRSKITHGGIEDDNVDSRDDGNLYPTNDIINDEEDDSEGSAEREARLAAGLDRDEAKQEVAKAVGSDIAGKSTKRPGAWRGEDRPARSYVFALAPSTSDKQKTKRKRGPEDSDDDSD